MNLRYEHLYASGTRIEEFCVYETKRHHSNGRSIPLPSMAAHLPCLPGSPPVSLRAPTSFVPPAHIQGVSLAFFQGHALWRLFLPTTGDRSRSSDRSASRFWPQAAASLCCEYYYQAASGLRISPIIFAASYLVPFFRIT